MTILPQPKKLKKLGDVLSVARMPIVLTTNCDYRIFKAAQKLADDIYDATGIEPMITKVLGMPDASGKIVIDCQKKKSEGYKLYVRDGGVSIIGDSLAGAFYGIQTLRQMVSSCGEDLECCEIDDKPDMQYRGFYHDASRGRVPTLEGVFKMIDFIAYYKHNSYQLYIEHTFQFDEYKGIYKAFGYMTAEEILEIDNYCYENFIDFIPSLSTFGHLFRLLASNKYKHLCELDEMDEKKNAWVNFMTHHTINPTDPESIQLIYSLIDQYVPLFRSKYFNICCDETMDLGKGKNAGGDAAELYVDFTLKIIEHLRAMGKTVMMWGDIILSQPHTLDRFPEDVIMLNWDYFPNPNLATVETFGNSKYRQIVTIGTVCWNHFAENIHKNEQNITKMIDKGIECKAMGMINTAWGDYGGMAPLTCSLYGIVLAASKAWNKKTKAICDKFDKTVSEIVFGDASGETVKLIRRLGLCQNVLSWGTFNNAYNDGVMYYVDNPEPLSTDSKMFYDNADECLKIAEEFRRLPVQSEMTNDLRIAAEGCAIVNRRFGRMIDNVPDTTDEFIEDWCERYAESWLRDDKLSELDAILTVMRGKELRVKDLITKA